MKSAIELNRKIFGMKFPWNLWVMMLGGVNMAGGLIYIQTLEGMLALGCLMAAFGIMWVIYARKGFVRLLGLGHIIAWSPLMVVFARTALQAETRDMFFYWLVSVLTLNGISLIIDVVDVARYSMGETQPLSS